MLATVDMYMANIEQSDNMVALHNLSVNTKKQLLWEPNLIYKFFFYKITDKKVMPCKRVTYPPSRASLLRSRGGGGEDYCFPIHTFIGICNMGPRGRHNPR